MFERLRGEHGFTGGYTIVKDYMRPAPDERRFHLHILAAVGAPGTALSLRAGVVAQLATEA